MGRGASWKCHLLPSGMPLEVGSEPPQCHLCPGNLLLRSSWAPPGLLLPATFSMTFHQSVTAPKHLWETTQLICTCPTAWIWGEGTALVTWPPSCLSFPPALNRSSRASLTGILGQCCARGGWQVRANPRCGPSGGATFRAHPNITPPCSPPQTPQHRTCT